MKESNEKYVDMGSSNFPRKKMSSKEKLGDKSDRSGRQVQGRNF